MSSHRVAAILAGLIVTLSSCSTSSGDSTGADVDAVEDAGSSQSEDQPDDAVVERPFSSLDELITAFGLSGCETSDGVVLQIATRSDESVACGDTVEIDWYGDQSTFEQARAQAGDQICSEVDTEWSYLVGNWWTLTAMLPVEPASDDTVLQILARRGDAGTIETYNC